MNYLDINGKTYEEDFPNLIRMLKDLANTINTDNWEGEKITYTFMSILPEVINHNMGVVPGKAVPINFEDAQGTFRFVSADERTVTLEASVSGLKLTFYLER